MPTPRIPPGGSKAQAEMGGVLLALLLQPPTSTGAPWGPVPSLILQAMAEEKKPPHRKHEMLQPRFSKFKQPK